MDGKRVDREVRYTISTPDSAILRSPGSAWAVRRGLPAATSFACILRFTGGALVAALPMTCSAFFRRVDGRRAAGRLSGCALQAEATGAVGGRSVGGMKRQIVTSPWLWGD